MSLAEYKYQDIIHRCFRCGYCKFPTDWDDVTNCPAYARYRLESYSTGGRLWLIRAWLTGEIQWSQHLAEIVYSCAACKNCVEKCPLSFHNDIVNMIIAAKNEMVELGLLPAPVKKFLQNIQLHGNPYGLPAKRRKAWMDGLNIESYHGQEYLYYVGCEGAYDTRAQLAARAVATLLLKTGISFGALGNDEACDGNEVEMLGEDGLVELVAEKNIKNFQKLGIKKIITLSPHAYNAFKNIYPRFGGEFKVFHYTQVLQDLLDRIKQDGQSAQGAKVTYHDPCFLGRWNSEYEAPRTLLKATGFQLIEMPRNKRGALCCGGGGGNFVTDFLGGSEESPARIRVREAHATGATILAVACPNCLTMLEDAVKVEGLEEELMVKDIAEILIESKQ
ncbi:MAG: (Fe-S)-binding protein [Deltaproteobacteria bacterium]|nr:(Fe-S)-binding protein [Deltaproteobacteria bacterium]